MKRIFSRLVTLLALCSLFAGTVGASDSGCLDLPKLDKYEIIELFQQLPEVTQPKNYYDEEPSLTDPHTPGTVRQELLDSGLARINLVRRLAGLPGVTMTDAYNLIAQKGSVVLAAGNQFTHWPAQPEGMDDDFYAEGYHATTHSNLAYFGSMSTANTPSLLADPISDSIDGYMSDSDIYNVSVVGHRRWVLDPQMAAVGLGMAHTFYRDGSWYCTDVYSTMYWNTYSGPYADYDFIAWPASGLFPNTNFIIDEAGNNAYRTPQSDAWSVSLNPRYFTTPTVGDITVTLTGPEGSWTFSGVESYSADNAGLYFNVDSQYIGEGTCIIFRPEGFEKYEGEYSVSITGLKTPSGQPTEIDYTVEFFTPTCLEGHTFSEQTNSATCTDPGSVSKTCSVCGFVPPAEEIPALGHQWGKGVQKDDSCHTVTCQRPGCGITEDLPHEMTTEEINGISVASCSGCDLRISSAVSLSMDVPTVTRWVTGEDGYVIPFGESEQLSLSGYTTLSGTLTWSLTDPGATGAVLDETGTLTVSPACTAGTLSIAVSDGTHSETILVELVRKASYCWGGAVPTPVSSVEVPLPGEENLQVQYNVTFYDQYGGIVSGTDHELSWFIQPQDDWDTEYTQYNGISIDSNGLLTVPVGAKSCELNVRVRPSCWNPGSSCGTSLTVQAEATVWWTSPGYLAWDTVPGAALYSVALYDEAGTRTGGLATYGTAMDLYGLLGLYLGNESQTYRVVVEAKTSSQKTILTLDPGLTLCPQISEKPLAYSARVTGANRYTLTVKHSISPGDILLDTWTTEDCRSSCSIMRLTYQTQLFSHELQIAGISHDPRLISDSRLEDGTRWVMSITATAPQSYDNMVAMTADRSVTVQSAPGSNVYGSCIVGPAGDQGLSAYVMLGNSSSQEITLSAIVAEYDANGRMLGCSLKELTIPAWDSASSLLYAQHSDAAQMNLFILNSAHSAMTLKAPL